MTRIEGKCDAAFRPVRDWLAASLDGGTDHGAAVSVTRDGDTVVDIWGGYRDADRTLPWERDTLVIVASTTKGLTGLCGNMCIDRGFLDPEAPASNYWPEFAAAGKAKAPVQYLFDHRIGLPELPGMGMGEMGEMGDWDAMCAALAAQAPAWDPGTAHAYHALTYGWLVGELVRRTTGKRPSQFLHEEVCGPLGVEAYIGAPKEVAPRIAAVVSAGGPQPFGDESLRRIELPAVNAYTNARSLARIYAVLACGGELDGVRLLDENTIEDAISYAVTGPWFSSEQFPPISSTSRFARGWALNGAVAPMGPNPRAFGYAGSGGSISWADPDARLSFAYTPNLFVTDIEAHSERAGQLAEVLFSCL